MGTWVGDGLYRVGSERHRYEGDDVQGWGCSGAWVAAAEGAWEGKEGGTGAWARGSFPPPPHQSKERLTHDATA